MTISGVTVFALRKNRMPLRAKGAVRARAGNILGLMCEKWYMCKDEYTCAET